jgi:hypothetical protein
MRIKNIVISVTLILSLIISQLSGIINAKAYTQFSTLTANEIIDKTLDLGFYKSKTMKNSTYLNPYGSGASRGYDTINIWAYNGENEAGGPTEFELGMTIADRNSEINNKIKTIFNLILPSMGDHFFNIVFDKAIYPVNPDAKGKDMWSNDQIVLLDSYGFDISNNHTSGRSNLSLTLDGRYIQIEFSTWTPLFIQFGPAEKNGIMTGWKYINGNYSYFDSKGSLQKNWLQLNNKWYYLGNDGTLKTGWQLINNKWYYLGYSGYMHTGWLSSNSNVYYFGDDGSMRTGWQLISGKWYYFNSSGLMHTGWLTINGNQYYFSPSDYSREPGEYGDMKTGWQTIDGSLYYFETNGVLKKS